MLNIFKYFFGVIGILILVYVLIVLLRTVLTSSFNFGSEIVNNEKVTDTISSTTQKAAAAISTASLVSWFKDFRPFQYSPVDVTIDKNNQSGFYSNLDENNSFWKSPEFQSKLYWQNLNDAPNTHPTDYVYVDENGNPISGSYGSGSNDYSESGNRNDESKIKISENYIKIDLRDGEYLGHGDIVTGKAFYKVFWDRKFPVYILNREGDTIGMVKAFANGDIERDGFVKFRAVMDLKNVREREGYLMFKNNNMQMSGIRAVNIVPIRIEKQFEYIDYTN